MVRDESKIANLSNGIWISSFLLVLFFGMMNHSCKPEEHKTTRIAKISPMLAISGVPGLNA